MNPTRSAGELLRKCRSYSAIRNDARTRDGIGGGCICHIRVSNKCYILTVNRLVLMFGHQAIQTIDRYLNPVTGHFHLVISNHRMSFYVARCFGRGKQYSFPASSHGCLRGPDGRVYPMVVFSARREPSDAKVRKRRGQSDQIPGRIIRSPAGPEGSDVRFQASKSLSFHLALQPIAPVDLAAPR